MGRFRCTGSLHGPLGDCLRPVVGALLCYGYLDEDQGVPLEQSAKGPRPLLFASCADHRPQLEEWAEHLWGAIANGLWIPAEGIPRALVLMQADDDPVVVAPDPSQAVRITA